MPPRLNLLSIARPIAYRPRPTCQWLPRPATRAAPLQLRTYADSADPPTADRSKRPDAKPEGHVSEEAAKTAEIMGEQGPDLSQGTPVEEVRLFRTFLEEQILMVN